jgi:phosphoenolpyruvate synthase/pyruvate phosphate dikinase
VLNIPIISEPDNAEIKKVLENIETKFQSYYEIAAKKLFLLIHCQVMVFCLLQEMISKFIAKL